MYDPSTFRLSSASTFSGAAVAPVPALEGVFDGALESALDSTPSPQSPAFDSALHPTGRITSRPGPLGQGAERRFALLDIADDHGRVHSRDLLFRRDSMLPASDDGESVTRVCCALANALLEGYAANSLPTGELMVPMDEAALSAPVARVVTPAVGVILLPASLPVTTQVLMRVAQLRSQGIRFSMDGISGVDDPRWLLSPYVDSVRLHLHHTPLDVLNTLVTRADAEGLEVIGCGVQSMTGYRRLEHLVVTRLQGPVIAAPLELIVPALPTCDPAALRRIQLLQASHVSAQATAVALSADPALVMRLLLLHRVYGGGRQEAPGSLAALVKSLPPGVLTAWLDILQRTACHGHHAGWSKAVRDQVEVYQRAALRCSDAQDREAVDASVWLFMRRLCSPAHYLKTLRYPA